MKALVCGGRDFSDYAWLCEVLDSMENSRGEKITEVIHGAARGADTYAGSWAKHNNIPVREFPADWQAFGLGAGGIRNKQMLDEGKPDLVIAFPGGAGTANMVRQAKLARVLVVQPK